MTHVATAVLEVTSPLPKSNAALTTSRTMEFRNQSQHSNTTVTTGTSNAAYVTWRIHSQRKEIVEPVQNTPMVKRTPTFTPQTKVVNGSIRSRMQVFETNKENVNGFNVTVKTSQRKLDKEIAPKSPEPEIIMIENRNGTHENSVLEKLAKFETKNSQVVCSNGFMTIETVSNGVTQNSETAPETVVLVKDALAKWEVNSGQNGKRYGSLEKGEKQDGEEKKRYRNVQVPIRPPAINIAVRPWTSSGQVVTDSDSKEVERILAQRRKLIEESKSF